MSAREERANAAQYMEFIQSVRRLFLDSKGEPTKDGKAFLDDIARFSHFRATTHFFDDVGRLDNGVAAQLEGRRQLYLRIHEWVFATPEELADIGRTMGGDQ